MPGDSTLVIRSWGGGGRALMEEGSSLPAQHIADAGIGVSQGAEDTADGRGQYLASPKADPEVALEQLCDQ